MWALWRSSEVTKQLQTQAFAPSLTLKTSLQLLSNSLPFIKAVKLLTGKTYKKPSTSIRHTCSCLFIEHAERGTVWLHKGLFLLLLLLKPQTRQARPATLLPRLWNGVQVFSIFKKWTFMIKRLKILWFCINPFINMSKTDSFMLVDMMFPTQRSITLLVYSFL